MAVNDVAAKDAANKKPKPMEDNFFMSNSILKGNVLVLKIYYVISKGRNMLRLKGEHIAGKIN